MPEQTGESPPSSLCHQLPSATDKQQHICVISPAEQSEGGGLRGLIQQLPHSVLELTHFTVTALSDAATCCHSHSFDTQHSFDSAIAALLPRQSVLRVTGTAAAFDSRHGLSEEVYVSFAFTLTSDTTATPSDSVQPVSTLPRLSLPALIDDDAVQLHTAYRLLADLLIPLYARVPLMGKRKQDTVGLVVQFRWRGGGSGADEADAASHASLDIVDILDYYHRQHVQTADEEYHTSPNARPAPLDSVHRFCSLCPAVRICSFQLDYSPASQPCCAIELAVQCESDMQVRGFYVVRPIVRFIRRSEVCLQRQVVMMTGQACATYSVAGSTDVLECSADLNIYLPAGENEARLTFDGDALSMMRLADVLSANSGQRPMSSDMAPSTSSDTLYSSLSPQLSSFTSLPYRTLDVILAAQLPSLAPCKLRAGWAVVPTEEYRGMDFSDFTNWLRCDYDERTHCIKAVELVSLTLSCVAPSSSTTPLFMLLDTRWPERGEDGFVLYRLRLAHLIPRRTTERLVPAEAFADCISPMSLTQLLTLIQLPVELIPSGLHSRVQFSDVSITLIVDAINGVLTSLAGIATCGVGRQDKLLFFNRLPAVVSSTVQCRQPRSVLSQLNDVTHSPITRWCSLQCRSVLDRAVFPHIHSHTAARCLDPLFQYVLCETEGDVELSRKATSEFRAGHSKLSNYSKVHAGLPSQLRPTSALFALQPHLPSGHWEMPADVLNEHSLDDSSVPSESALSTSGSPALVGISNTNADVLHHVASYLDTNSLLFGLIPAAHSLPSLAKALNDGRYGRPMLLSRYGALCDAALWSAGLLGEWRLDKLRRDAAELEKQWESINVKTQSLQSLSLLQARTSSFQHVRAVHRNDHLAAIFDLQTRINKYVIRVMLQRKEDVLPQLYPTPAAVAQRRLSMAKYWSHTVQPTYLTPPDAAMALLLCAPPFHAVPTHNDTLATGEKSSQGRSPATVPNVSPHVVRFADIYTQGQSVLSLYMGPVYVMADAHTAERGVEVGVAVPITRKNRLGFAPLMYRNRRRSRARRADTVVRQLYIDDVNQLPVTVRLDDIDSVGAVLMIETMADSFERLGVTSLVEQKRTEWRRVANEHRAAAGIALPEPYTTDSKRHAYDSTDSQDEGGEQDEEKTGEEDVPLPRNEYAYMRELMREWLSSLRRSMGEKRWFDQLGG